ncbi:MAG: 16S rRNA (guanine(966)-N(2))-methyltransferase RsmD [Bacillota bacterium]
MRVIAGQARGRRLLAPKGRGVRPTTDRVRQSLMDILVPWTEGRAWLDLFAGSGAVGIEALSRGACLAVFVESDRRAAEVLEANLVRTGLRGRAEIRQSTVRVALEDLAREGRAFDVVFADPPYGQGFVAETAREVARLRLVSPPGLLVIQHSARERPGDVEGLRLAREAAYGETVVSFFSPELGD